MATFFTVEFHSDGILRKRFQVPANAVYGLTPYPDYQSTIRKLPAQLWPAYDRGSWWADKYAPEMPMRLDLVDAKGKPLGTLFAKEL